MFAVIKSGGKQYKVVKNDVLKLEKLEGQEGAVIVFDDVFAVGEEGGNITIGTPLVKDVKVSAEILNQTKDEKIIIFKKKRRQNYRRKRGHRQQVTFVRIQDIGKDLKPKAAPDSAKKEAKKPESEAKPVVKKAPAKKAAAKAPAAKKTAEKK